MFMLKNSFYIIEASEQINESTFKSTLKFNKDHEIFGGHFPGLPIVPGVCMMQIVKELLEENFGRKLLLKQAGNIKFLNPINPIVNPQVDLEIKIKPAELGSYQVEANIGFEGISFFKITQTVYVQV